jgi:tRNA nucleotidyltransferase (CCA-adding enzyme)
MDAYAEERVGDEREDLVVGFAVLCHDLGKPPTTRFEDGRVRSRGHDTEGVPLTRSFMARLTNQEDLIEEIAVLVECHLRPVELHKAGVPDTAVRRLARKVRRIDRLVRVARADQRGRPPMPFDGFPAGTWLLERAKALDVSDAAPRPIVMGRHLVELGLKPGPRFKEILDSCYEAQLDGRIADIEQGLAFLKDLLSRKPPP